LHESKRSLCQAEKNSANPGLNYPNHKIISLFKTSPLRSMKGLPWGSTSADFIDDPARTLRELGRLTSFTQVAERQNITPARSKLTGGTLNTELAVQKLDEVLVDGFFAEAASGEMPTRQRRVGMKATVLRNRVVEVLG
jgi:hypothetical protein